MVATVEMAVTKGNYGIILLNSITNVLKNGSSGFSYRALFLEKESEKWNIKAGVEWPDTYFNVSKTKWTLPENETIDNVFWKKTRICQLSQQCEAQLQGKSLEKKEKTYEWQTPSSSDKNIWQGLKIDVLDPSGTSESDFWNGEDTPIDTSSRIAVQPYAIFVDSRYWGVTHATLLNGQSTTFKNWFKIFENEKGEWKTQSST